MQRSSRALAVALLAVACALAGVARAEEPPSPRDLTLDQAIEIAFRKSPRLRAERARVSEAEGRLVGAETYPLNPEIEVRGGPRLRDDGTTGDFEVGLGQDIELSGKRGRRIDTASAEVLAARASAARFERLLAAEVDLAFIDALEARDMLEVTRAEAELADQLLDLASRRLGAGAGTQLDVNVAAAELGRAEQAAGVQEGRFAAARAVLAEVLALEAAALPSPAGVLDPAPSEPPPLESLLAEAERRREDLQALREVERAARARIELARAEAWPNLRVGVFGGLEGSADTLLGVAVGIPLPIFQRNQGPIAEAEATAVRVAAERDTAVLSVVREVVSAYEQHRAGVKALRSLRERVVGTTEENLELLRKAFEAGKTGWVEVLVMRKTLFDARRAFVETAAEVRRARVRIDIAAGQTPVPAGNPREPRP